MKDVLSVLPIIEIMIVMVVIYSIVESILRLRSGPILGHDFQETMRAALEPKLGTGLLLEVVLTELTVLYYSIWIPFQKPTGAREGEYTSYKSSQIKTFITVFAFIVIGEGILLHYLIHLWSVVAAWIFTVLNIYALLYMVGLYYSVKGKPHRIEQSKLVICNGFQSSMETEIENIESISRAIESDFRVKLPHDTYYAMLKIDSPHIEIKLKAPVLMRAAYGRNKYVKTVVFRADEFSKMLEEIQSKLKDRLN